MIVPQENFDIDKTIFATLDSEIVKKIQASKIGVTLYWTDQAAMRINASFAKVPQAPRYDQCLVDFMEHECDFAVEHADGSFMDHLRFCFEYSHAHYPQKSPRVLLLHSIMGVGTNFFPMAAEVRESISYLQVVFGDAKYAPPLTWELLHTTEV
jgi:hypothetical protein